MSQGYVSLILHAHLPYVRHPEYDDFLEEKWFFEAMTETYIPLINTFNKLKKDNIDFRLTMTLSPTLLSLMSDDLMKERYLRFLNKTIELTEKEIERTNKEDKRYAPLARMYNERLKSIYDTYVNKYNLNIINGFKEYQNLGYIEIMTCAATHGFLPFMAVNPYSMKAQVKTGVDTYKKFFDKHPNGFWLPECAYTPEIDYHLKNEGINYTVTETHGIAYARPRPKYGVYAPIITPNGIAVFGRDAESSKQVWSATEGYPGDYEYRDFYRDIGFDLDYEYIKPYIHPDGIKIHTGIKYYKITGKSNYKEKYNREKALDKAALHAGNFMFNREKQIEYFANGMERPPLIVCPYDAELFGHWWFEGPEWIEYLFRKVQYDQNTFSFINPKEYLEKYPENQVCSPNPSSWGNKGYYEVWLNGSNDWIYRHLHKAAERMNELATLIPNAVGLTREALNQAVRELLLAQSSDWAFILDSGTMTEYAQKRIEDHIERFTKLYNSIKSNTIDESWLNEIKYKDNIFPDIDYQVFKESPEYSTSWHL